MTRLSSEIWVRVCIPEIYAVHLIIQILLIIISREHREVLWITLNKLKLLLWHFHVNIWSVHDSCPVVYVWCWVIFVVVDIIGHVILMIGVVLERLKMIGPVKFLMWRRHIYFAKIILVKCGEAVNLLLMQVNSARTSISDGLHGSASIKAFVEWIVKLGRHQQGRLIVWENRSVRAHMRL